MNEPISQGGTYREKVSKATTVSYDERPLMTFVHVLIVTSTKLLFPLTVIGICTDNDYLAIIRLVPRLDWRKT